MEQPPAPTPSEFEVKAKADSTFSAEHCAPLRTMRIFQERIRPVNDTLVGVLVSRNRSTPMRDTFDLFVYVDSNGAISKVYPLDTISVDPARISAVLSSVRMDTLPIGCRGLDCFKISIVSIDGMPSKATSRIVIRKIIGGRSKSNVIRVTMQNLPGLRRAYNQRLREHPGLGGRITVKFSIDANGAVVSCELVGTTVDDPELENEIIRKILKWPFGRIELPGNITWVVYPFVFAPR